MNWKMFWEQYSVLINLKPGLSEPEKLAYLRQALKDGQAKNVIEGLSGLGDDYKDAVEYLRRHYDKPRLNPSQTRSFNYRGSFVKRRKWKRVMTPS